MNILFVCSMNKWRSPTAEHLYAKHPFVNVRSAGTSGGAKRTISCRDVRWADMIFVMEYKHKQRISAEFRQELNGKELIVLDIPDDYQYMDPELVEILEEAIDPELEAFKGE